MSVKGSKVPKGFNYSVVLRESPTATQQTSSISFHFIHWLMSTTASTIIESARITERLGHLHERWLKQSSYKAWGQR